jgi:hypothetical protein
MSDLNKGKVELNVGLSARASLEAKISTEIPSRSTGRLVDAITDVFRPFAERRGLKADLIRLQREDVLIEIAKKAYKRLEIENAVPSPIPTKFLVPFLEKASLEDGDSYLIDRWADLLVSSSMEPEAAHPRFVQILSELGVAEAQLLRNIALYKVDNVRDLKHQLDRYTFAGLPDNYRRAFVSMKLVNDDPELRCRVLACKMMCLIAGPGSSVIDMAVAVQRANSSLILFDMSASQQPTNVRQGKNKFYLDILCSLHLLNQYNFEATRPDFWRIDVSYVVLTPLGVEFLQSCDRDIKRRILKASETVNRVCDEAEYCPTRYDPEWGRRGYKWWTPSDAAEQITGR